MAKDPVCGMDVDESTAKHTSPGHTPSMGGHGN